MLSKIKFVFFEKAMKDVEILYSNIFISSNPLSSKARSISYQSFIKKMKASKTKKLFLLPNLPYASHQLICQIYYVKATRINFNLICQIY